MAYAATNVDRLERFWRECVLTYPDSVRIKKAVVCHVFEHPVSSFNHVTGVSVNDDEAEDFIKTVIKHFSSRKLPFACFRLSPLTRPASLASLLVEHGFEKLFEQSIMVYKGKPLEDKLNPNVEIRKISKKELDTFQQLFFANFELPPDWRRMQDRLALEWMRRGARDYVAYIKGRPVGTAVLFSLKKTGGIFGIGTLKEYRKQGIGSTLTVRALLDSIDQGNNLHTLQTDKGGYTERLYQRIGFETDHTVAFFVKKL